MATLKRGQTLARQGEPARHFYLVESGFLKVLQLTAEGTELIMRFVAAGEPFGGVVALGNAPYPVTAIATQPTVVHALDARHRLDAPGGHAAGEREHHARDGHAHDRCADARPRTDHRARGTAAGPHPPSSGQAMRRADPDGVLITQPLTRQELADLTGTTLYTVSRTLTKWEAMGLLESRKRLLLLRSLRKLEDVSGSDDD